MEEQFKFGDKVVVWDIESGIEHWDAYFIAKNDGEYPYIVVLSEKTLSDIKSGNIVASAAYKNCRKANPMQKYEGAISKSELDNHELVDIFFNLIEARNAVWEVDYWKPNWQKDGPKYIINIISGKLSTGLSSLSSCPFAFRTPEIRDWFMEKFEKELNILLENNLL